MEEGEEKQEEAARERKKAKRGAVKYSCELNHDWTKVMVMVGQKSREIFIRPQTDSRVISIT